jgi:hypothetical protein
MITSQFSEEVLGSKIASAGSTYRLSKEICMYPDAIEGKGIAFHSFD